MDEETANKTLEILRQVNAIITHSHFVLTTGRHSDVYINKDALYPHTKEISKICSFIAETYKDEGIDVVAGPALGGIVLSQWTAYHLTMLKGKEVLGVYTEKTADKNQIFKRGYDVLIKGKKVLVVEDLTTTGGSVKKVVNSVRYAGGTPVAVCVMVNRRPDRVTSESVSVPFSSLSVLKARDYPEEECPWCKEDRPINRTVGHWRDFLKKRRQL